MAKGNLKIPFPFEILTGIEVIKSMLPYSQAAIGRMTSYEYYFFS